MRSIPPLQLATHFFHTTLHGSQQDIPAGQHSSPQVGPKSICARSRFRGFKQFCTNDDIVLDVLIKKKPKQACFLLLLFLTVHTFFLLWLHIFEVFICWCGPNRAAPRSQWDWVVDVGWRRDVCRGCTAFGPDSCGDLRSLVTAEKPAFWESGVSAWTFIWFQPFQELWFEIFLN